eukprot:6491209-Amphidinium_carterae.4
MDKEAARLNLDPKGQVQSSQQQPTAQQGQNDNDGFQPVRSRKGKPKTTKPADAQSKTEAIITLCPGQIASGGVSLPVREKLLMHVPGVTVVTDLAQLKSLHEVFAKSKETQVAVAPCRFDWEDFDGDIDIWSLTIQTDTAGVLKELETQAAVYHLAGPSPQHTSSVPVVTLTAVVTEVVRVTTSKAAWQQGRWIYQDPSPKQLRTMFKDISEDLVAAVLDAWKPQTAQETKSVLVRVHRKHVHSFLSVATKAGFACVPSRSFTEGSKVLWLREKTLRLSDAVNKADQIVQDIEETDRWKRKSAVVIKEADGKTSFGVRVPEEQYAKTKQQDGQDARPLWVVRGASASWTNEDLQDVLDQLRWPAQIVRAMGPRAYLLRCEVDPPRRRQPAQSGYEKLILEFTEYVPRNAQQKPKKAEQDTIPGQRSWASVVKAPVTTVRKLKTSWADQCEQDEPGTPDAMEDEEWEDDADAPPSRAWTSHPTAQRISLATPRGRSLALDEPLPKKPKAEGEADILRQVIVDLRQQNQQLQQQLAALTQQVTALTQQVVRGQSVQRSSDEECDEDEDLPFVYHEIDQCLQTYLQYPYLDPTRSRWSHLTLHCTPWEVMYPKCRDMQWENVSGQHNLCFWRCAQRQLAAANHAHRSKEPEDIKQLVMTHAIANADRIAQDTGFDTATFIAHAQQAMQKHEMATEHCIAAFEHQAAWIYIPTGETMAGPSMLVWLHQQHFQSGPTFDLAQINHAISSNADEEAFKSFCLRGGHEAGPWTVTALKHVQAIHTANITSWGTLSQQFEHWRANASLPPVLAIQEHHLPAARIEQLYKIAARWGYKAEAAPATPTGHGGTHGGVAVLARKHVAMSPVQLEVPPALVGRVCTVKIAYHGHYHVTSLYPLLG